LSSFNTGDLTFNSW